MDVLGRSHCNREMFWERMGCLCGRKEYVMMMMVIMIILVDREFLFYLEYV